MKNFLIPVFILFAFGGLCLFPTGCSLLGSNPGGPTVSNAPGQNSTISDPGIAGSVLFQIVLPNEPAVVPLNRGKALAGIRASTTAPSVTAKLIFINVGNTTQPTTSLTKTVLVDASGSAQLEFSGVPALTCIGDIHIAGGQIASWSDFHGVCDLQASYPNVLVVAPKGQAMWQAILASVLERIIADPTLFPKVPLGFAQWMNLALVSLSSAESGLEDQAFSIVSERLSLGSPFQVKSEVGYFRPSLRTPRKPGSNPGFRPLAPK